MITHINIRGFKKLKNISFDFGDRLVLIGPNNSGKTSVFQALCLWEMGVVSHFEAVAKKELNSKGYVTLNRKELLNTIVNDARFLWNDKLVTRTGKGKATEHIPLSVTIQGREGDRYWTCQAEFMFANAESFTCRVTGDIPIVQEIFEQREGVRFSFLQPMSGLSEEEDLLQRGSVARKLGMGRTAEVLRNICYTVLHPEKTDISPEQSRQNWETLCAYMYRLFGFRFSEPVYVKATGLIELTYQEPSGVVYDISASGRGVQQSLLILAYLFSHPRTVLLLDEPDAHLEIIRQREILDVIAEVATRVDSQIMIASHSEVVLNQAAQTGDVIALIENKAFLLTDQNISQFRKSLTEIGWEKYYLARLKGHVLYLEGATDLRMLLAFAHQLQHPVENHLSEANIEFLGNNLPRKAEQHFFGLKAVFPELRGLTLLDRIETATLNKQLPLLSWQKRELENYLASPELLIRFADTEQAADLMQLVIQDYTFPAYLRDRSHAWWSDAKLSDDWMGTIFEEYYKRKGGYVRMDKSDFYKLISLLAPEEIHPEVSEKLDALLTFLAEEAR